MNSLVSRLINFAKINLGLNDFDVSYVSNKIFDILQIEERNLVETDIVDVNVSTILNELYKKICSINHISISAFNKISDAIMDALTPLPSLINDQFQRLLSSNYAVAFDYYLSLMKSNNHINNIPYFGDKWFSNFNGYTMQYVLQESDMPLKNGLNARKICFDNKYCFTLKRSQDIINYIDFMTKNKSIKERYLSELEFVHTFENMFLLDNNDKIIGGENSLKFFHESSSYEFTNKYFLETKISVLNTIFSVLKLSSSNIDELIDAVLYIDNIWKILGENNYSIKCFTRQDDNVAFVILLNKNIKEDEDIYIKRTVDKDLMYLGVCILDGQTKKDISKIANILSNHTFDVEWYLAANEELVSYKDMIDDLLKDKQYCEDKNEAITLIQNYFSCKITNALTKYIVYNNSDLENIESFLNLIK